MGNQRLATESEFPKFGDPVDQFRFLLEYARLAPSGHNTQPWHFSMNGSDLELYADRSRALTVVDPDDRELCISCGAVLSHIRIAMEYYGISPLVEILPSEANPDLLASIGLGDTLVPDEDTIRLFDAIPLRHTNRFPFEERGIDAHLRSRLQEMAGKEGVKFHILEGEKRKQVEELIAEGDSMQGADREFREELSRWIRTGCNGPVDGMPGSAFGFGRISSHLGPFVLKTFDWGKRQAKKDSRLLESAPLLGVFISERDLPHDWLATGQALSAVLLYARSKEIWASFMNQPIELLGIRKKLMNILSSEGYPQIIIRMGYGRDVDPTPRRSVDDIFG